MSFTLPTLPYEKTDLEPYISSNTLAFHHEKHHQTYINNLNKLIEGTDLENKSLDEIMAHSSQDPTQTAIYNNAAQVWNHTFFFNGIKKNGGGKPQGELLEKMTKSFGTFEQFKDTFKQTAIGQFGSGWGWLGLKDGGLEIFKTGNADNHIRLGFKPLLVIDVWEHAYYLDYQNRRADYVEAFLTNLINWNFVAQNL